VTIDGRVCSNLIMVTPHTKMTCTLPAGNGWNVSVTLSRGAQVSSYSWVSYKGPYWSRGSLRRQGQARLLLGGGNGASYVTATSTLGGDILEIYGFDFLVGQKNLTHPNMTLFKAWYSPVLQPRYYPCNVLYVNMTFLRCSTQKGVGKNLQFQVAASGRLSPLSDDIFSYPPPTMTTNTLRQTSISLTTNDLTALSSQGEAITFNGTNLGWLGADTIITMGPKPYVCQHISNPIDRRVICQTPPGVGANLQFRVQTSSGPNAQIYQSNDTYTYPVSPVIVNITGCSGQSGSLATGCITEGWTSTAPVVLSLTGYYFGPFPTVTIGGRYCLSVLNIAGNEDGSITCQLPAGTGLNQLVVVKQGSYYSRPVPLLSYSIPTITAVYGCDDSNTGAANWTLNCPRYGGTKLTLVGKNFGASGAQVVVAGQLCLNVAHDSSTPHYRLTCDLPSGTGLGRGVMMFQYRGEASQDDAQISYEICEPGFYSSDLDCLECDGGSYANLYDQGFCFPCPAGTSANDTGRTACDACEEGKYSELPGSYECIDCPTGSYSSTPGTVVCVFCSIGTAAPLNGSIACDDCIAGSYQSSTASSDCIPCTAGTVSEKDGQPSCIKCGAGTIAAIDGSSQCDICDAGTRSNAFQASTQCIACDYGTISTASGQATCDSCTPGKFSEITGGKYCKDCGLGRFTLNTGQSSCVDCVAGTYAGSQSSSICLQCSLGYYSPVNASFACYACDAGTYTNDYGGSQCLDCAAGYFQSSGGQSSCEICRSGTYGNDTGLSTCSRCSAGSYNPTPGATTCTLCPLGKVSTHSGTTVCTDCSAGKAARNLGSSTCDQCNPGYYVAVSGSSTCLVCEAGKYSLGEAASCSVCAPGKISASNTSSTCGDCPTGYYQNSPSSSVCLECSAGKISSSEGRSDCSKCPSGRYSNSTGSSLCSICASGSYASSLITEQTTCQLCDAGTYQSSSESDRCKACGQGQFSSSSGATVCDTCIAGKYNDIVGSTECIECPTGSVVASPGQKACAQCGEGTYANDTGLIVCRQCPAGYFSPSPGTSTCQACAIGSFNRSPAQKQCTVCDVGRYAKSAGSSECDSCSAGYYQPDTGRAECLACDTGKYSAIESATVCTPCQAGYAQNVTASTGCLPCAPGYYAADSVEGQAHCTPCATGTFATLSKSVTCRACALGTYAPMEASTTCSICQAGSFGGALGGVQCTNCSVGESNSLVNSPQCYPCAAGSAAPLEGQATCTACAPGKYQPISGNAECRPCSRGYYSLSQGALECTPTQAGEYTPIEGETSPTKCLAGWYQSEPHQSFCEVCATGKYSTEPGAKTCALCETGKAAASNSSTKCDDCPSGKFQSSLGQSTCVLCTNGTFNSASKVTGCNTCDPGTYASGYGQSTCTKCDVGSYQGQIGANECTSCTLGRYAAVQGATVCTLCASGTHSDLDGTTCTPCAGGYYADSPGSSECKICILGKYSTSSATECTLCGDRTAAPNDGATTCMQCSRNAIAREDRSQCVCNTGYYANDVNLDPNVVECYECPYGAKCDEPGLLISTMQTISGWWRADNQSLEFYRCLLPEHCGIGVSSTCLGHRRGPLCAICDVGYRSQSGVSKCQECPTKGTATATMVLLTMAVVAACIFIYWLVLFADRQLIHQVKALDAMRVQWDKHDAELVAQVDDPKNEEMQEVNAAYSRRAPNLTFKIKIMIGFLQITMNMAFVIDVEWPATYRSFLQIFSFVNLDFVPWQSVGCVTQFDWYVKYGMVVAAPVGALLLLWLVFLLPRTVRSWKKWGDPELRRAANKRARRKWWKLVLFTLFLMYPGVSSTVLSIFVCRDINGVPFLLADFTLRCHDTKWYWMMWIAIPAVLVYPIGVPAFFFYMLNRYKSRMAEPGVRLELGFLYAAYNDSSWYFELIDMANKLTMTSLLAFFPPSFQMPLAMICITVFMIILLIRTPYSRKGDDQLQLLAVTEAFLVVMAAYNMSLLGRNLERSVDLALSVLFIALTCLTLVLFVLISAKNLRRIISRTDWRKVESQLCLRPYIPKQVDVDDDPAMNYEIMEDDEIAMVEIANKQANAAAAQKRKRSLIARAEEAKLTSDAIEESTTSGGTQVGIDIGFVNPLFAGASVISSSRSSVPRSLSVSSKRSSGNDGEVVSPDTPKSPSAAAAAPADVTTPKSIRHTREASFGISFPLSFRFPCVTL
jgi:hypothetical protein